MARSKGTPKTGGRKAGTPSKFSQANFENLIAQCEEAGVHPFQQMLQIAKDPSGPHGQWYFHALKELCSYLYPKKKALEVSGSIETNTTQEAIRRRLISHNETLGLLKQEEIDVIPELKS